MTEGCGRIRKELVRGWTPLVDSQLRFLRVGALSLAPGDEWAIDTGTREYAFVLVRGQVDFELDGGPRGVLGPRENPFDHPPYALFTSRDARVTFKAGAATLLGVGSAPAEKKLPPTVITPGEVGGGSRGLGNWQRDVRFVCWTDNSQGNMLITGETVTPSGNWSTIPPHRHQYDKPGEEVPYEEAYFFQFSKPQGYGLAWQFDDDGLMDQAFSLRNNDVLFMDAGYHPTAAGPGATLYHLTFIAGPHRMSRSRVHDDFRFLLDENSLDNPYARQFVKKQND